LGKTGKLGEIGWDFGGIKVWKAIGSITLLGVPFGLNFLGEIKGLPIWTFPTQFSKQFPLIWVGALNLGGN